MANLPSSTKETLAWDFAIDKHKDQKRKFSGKPYFDAHVKNVNGIVKQYSVDVDILCASLLHDVLEDCYTDKWVGYKDIKEKFGKKVADIVMELTSDSGEIENKYDDDKGQYLITKMLKMSEGALVIKLCDRLQNISDAFIASKSFREKYFKETSRIVDALESGRRINNTHRKILNDIKSKLNNISSIFKIKRFNEYAKYFKKI